MVRNTEKKLLQSHTLYESLAEMVTKACDPIKPSLVKSLQKNRDKLDNAYQELYYDFRVYKDDVADPKFNEKNEDGVNEYAFNDEWFKTLKDEYFDLVEKSDEKLEEVAGSLTEKVVDDHSSESKASLDTEKKKVHEEKVRKLLENQMEGSLE